MKSVDYDDIGEDMGKKPKSSDAKANFQYPTGDTPSAKVPMSSQKTNPPRRNRSY